MYNATLLETYFASLVGFAQAYDEAYPQLPEELLASDSGRLVQQMHPLCTVENIFNTAPELKDNTAFINFLKATRKAAILETFADFIRARKLENANRSLVDAQILFDGIGSFADRIIKEGRFVGLQLKVSSQQGLQATVQKMGLQLDGAQQVPIYLFHTSVLEPLKTFPLEVGKPSTFNWQAVQDAVLKFYEDSHDTAGSFLLGYYETDLNEGVQALNREYNFKTGPCMGCNEYNWNAFNTWSKYVKILPFSFGAGALQEAEDGAKLLPDVSKIAYAPATNWGLNLALSIQCDLTEFFRANRLQFADALGMKLCLKFLSQIAYSTRMNDISDKTKALAMADLSTEGADSFFNLYQKELKALAVDFSGISSACLPAERKGVTLGAV